MRIKYEKGLTPERIADEFVRFIRDNNIVIGAVNVYIQTYDEEMKLEKHARDDRYLIVSPKEFAKQEYTEDVSQTRRKRLKVV